MPRYTWDDEELAHSWEQGVRRLQQPAASRVAHECAEELSPHQRLEFAGAVDDFYDLDPEQRAQISGLVARLYARVQEGHAQQDELHRLIALLPLIAPVPRQRGAKHAGRT